MHREVEKIVTTVQPTTIGNRYQLQNLIGQGANGTVFHAVDRLTGQHVALKRVPLSVNENPTVFFETSLALANEFQLLSTLRHPNIVSVLNYGFDADHQPYLVTELLDQSRLITEVGYQQSLETQVDLLVQLLQALDYLHWREIAHRDLKPANILVVGSQVKVIDFGLSTLLTQPDAPAGTLEYLPPEIAEMFLSERVDWSNIVYSKVDIYAVGVIGYEMKTGDLPFKSADREELAVFILDTDPNLDNLEALAPVVARLLQKKPELRYDNARAVIDDLRQLSSLPIIVEPRGIRESFLQTAKFVGREDEFSQLADALKQALSGRGSAWLVSGESGVGKSRLIDELKIQAMVQGAQILRGQATSEANTSYQSWGEALRLLALIADMDDLEQSVLKALIPDLNTLLERAIPDAPELDAQATQERLWSVIEAVFKRQKQPMVLILEDIQWAGGESLEVLRRITQAIRDVPLLILASYRDDERPDLAQTFPDLSFLKLGRLKAPGIAELSASILGAPGCRPDVLRLLERETEGNVFFLVEAVRALAEEAGQLDKVSALRLPEHIVTGGIQQLIQRRLNRVPGVSMPLLEVAAIAGRQLDLALLHSVDPGVDIERWLLDCANAAVLEIQEDQWRFTHDKVREELLRTLSVERRLERHRQVALALENVYGEAQAISLAYHWKMAGDLEKDVYYSALAGERLLQSGGSQEARRLLEHALEIDAQLGHGMPDAEGKKRWARWRRGIGEACLWSGDLGESHRQFKLALALLDFPEPQQKREHLPRIIRSMLVQWFHRALPGRWRDKLHPDAPSLLEAAIAYSRIAELTYYGGNNTLMVLAVFSALNLAERSGQISLPLVIAYTNASIVTTYLNLRGLTHTYLRRALEVAQQLNQPFALALALTRNSLYSIAQAQWSASNAALEQALALEQQIGAERYARETSSALAVSLIWQGHYERSLSYLAAMNLSSQRTGDTHYQAISLVCQAPSWLAMGEFEKALTVLNEATNHLAHYREAAVVNMETMQAGLFALTYLYLGSTSEARRYALEAAGLLINHPTATSVTLMCMSTCLETLLTLQEKEADDPDDVLGNLTAQCLLALRNYAHRNPVGRPAYKRLQGVADWDAGHRNQATRQWREGLEDARRLRIPAEVGLLHYELGRHLDPLIPDRLTHLRQAEAVFREIGAKYYLERVVVELNRVQS